MVQHASFGHGWSIAAPITWAIGCTLAAIILLFWHNPQKHGKSYREALPGRHRLYFGGYLFAHLISTIPQALSAARFTGDAENIRAFQYLASFFVLLAGHSYFLLAAELLAPCNLRVRQLSCLATACVFVLTSPSLAILHFGTARAGSPLVIAVYGIACALAFFGVFAVLRRNPSAWQARLFACAAIAGVVDALFPIFAPSPLADFLARLLDVLLWLPGAVVAMRWLDATSVPPAQPSTDIGGSEEEDTS